MTVYDIYTKEVDGKWVSEPVLVATFDSFAAATSYLEKYAKDCGNPLAMSFYKETSTRFMLGKSKTFGVGAKRFCKAREI
jgi:hypothetical protein